MTTRAPSTGALGPAPAPGAPRPPSGTTELDQAVSSEVLRLQASYWDGQLAAAEQKTVVLVEGDDDRDVIEIDRPSPIDEIIALLLL